jgi:glycosyltransferase involved in cell wall biosynthesis
VRLGVLVSGIPSPTTGGGALTAWSVVAHLVERGHEVTALCLVPPSLTDPAGASAEERAGRLEQLGARVVLVEPAARPSARPGRLRLLRRLLAPEPAELYPTLRDAGAVGEEVRRAGLDALFVYHFDALAASTEVAVPRVAGVGDPSHLPVLYRWRQVEPKRLDRQSLRRALEVAAVVRRQPRVMVELLNGCAAAGAFAAHHAAWLRRRGVRDCLYLRTPIPEPAGPRPATGHDGPPTLLHIGHLRGTATLHGLRLFVQETLPRLDEALGPDGFRLDLVGGYRPPDELREALDRPSIRFRGHLEPATDAIREADVLVVPIAIPLGVRVRVLTGFSVGACIAAHAVNSRGIPELAHGENALLGSSGASLADEIARAVRDAELRARLRAGARDTYERYFAQPVAAGRIEGLLAEAVR